jgi:DNA-binding IclR family transcriptional regulator
MQRHVRLIGFHLATQRTNVIGRALHLDLKEIDETDIEAIFRKIQCAGTTNTPRAAGDNRYLFHIALHMLRQNAFFLTSGVFPTTLRSASRIQFIYMNRNLVSEVKSAVRALELLELLARSSEPLSLKEIVAELGYPKSSTHSLLATLVSRGYAIREEPEQYRLHEACRNGAGWRSGREAQLIAVAQPIMDSLRDEEGETVFLGVRKRDGRVKVLAKSTSRQAIKFDSDISSSDPAYCTAMGRILLAFWSPQQVDDYLGRERLIRHTSFTVTDRREIRRTLETVRKTGYALCDQEAYLGGSGVAAPVHDAAGTVVAVLNMATVTVRFEASKERMIAATQRYARLLSAKLGFKGTVSQQD